MNSSEISAYWQAYPDLTELWAKGIWDETALGQHFMEHGKGEGRIIPQAGLQPKYWSDWLFFGGREDDASWWWKKGVIDSGVYGAILGGDEWLAKGTIEKSAALQAASALDQQALAQVALNAFDHPGAGPLADILAQKLQWAEPKSIGILPMREAVEALFPDKNRYVILLPWLESGGAELVGMWQYLAAEKLGLNPLIVLTDQPNITARFAARNFDILNLPSLFEATMDKPYSHLSREERMEVLSAAIEVLQPEILHLIHAYIGYSALTALKTKPRIRAACSSIFVSAFCPHIHPDGHYDGYFREIPELVDVVDQFVFDNDWYLGEMEKTYALPASQSSALKYPIEGLAARVKAKKAPDKVLWASRFDSQKNPKIVAEIARRMPDTTFVMYGRQVLGDDEINWDEMPENVQHGGEFFNISELPIKECFAFLYTSKFDGTPNILLEIGAQGLPIVTPNIGGIAGFLGDSWPLYVQDPEDIDGYVTHLGELQKSAKLAKSLCRKQDDILKTERSFAHFTGDFEAMLARIKAS